MTNASEIRAKAAQLRQHAAEYAAWTAWPLLSRAYALEQLAAELDRNGRERRCGRLTLKDLEEAARPHLFGRRSLGPAA